MDLYRFLLAIVAVRRTGHFRSLMRCPKDIQLGKEASLHAVLQELQRGEDQREHGVRNHARGGGGGPRQLQVRLPPPPSLPVSDTSPCLQMKTWLGLTGLTEILYTSEKQKTHQGRPFQSACRGWSVSPKNVGALKYLSLSHSVLATSPRQKMNTWLGRTWTTTVPVAGAVVSEVLGRELCVRHQAWNA